MLFDEGKGREVTTLQSGDRITFCQPNCVRLTRPKGSAPGGRLVRGYDKEHTDDKFYIPGLNESIFFDIVGLIAETHGLRSRLTEKGIDGIGKQYVFE